MKKHGLVRYKMQLWYTLGIVLILLSAEVLSSVVEFALTETGVISAEQLQNDTWMVFVWSAVTLTIGVIFSIFLPRIILKPLDKLLDGFSSLSAGHYETRIEVKEGDSLARVYNEFNALAGELEKTEMLRADFVNSFSHEFKTPISSINGLIKLMQKGNLTKEKQKEYLEVIAEEAARLSLMATNILNLSKYESQGVLKDKTTFNLSEQIRTCTLLLEKKWSAKGLKPSLEFDEHKICGNEEMLRQVWVNLIDNAIKFADRETELILLVEKKDGNMEVTVVNYGVEISKEDQARIFNKFYQADRSHSKEGNGIGLSIVKRIVELHKGSIKVISGEGRTAFTVILPVD